jgi:hypothetical protein
VTKFSIVPSSDSNLSVKGSAYVRRHFNLDAFYRRMERFDARLRGVRTDAMAPPPRHLDARLFEEGQALETAWAYEVAALIARKKLNAPEADAAAKAARAATAAVAARIEAMRAVTLEGLKIKSRVLLWRRYGEPLGTEGREEESVTRMGRALNHPLATARKRELRDVLAQEVGEHSDDEVVILALRQP